ncbi:hypothetical protein, partial [Deinococcus pimensis]|uniref:hypothetical protein n=1 Tax=Deinococcus pimensis TaxID=309888 RepID=UPI0005EADD83
VAQLQPDGFAARASTLLLARPLPGLSATLGGTYVSSTLPGTRSSWSLTPTVAYSARLGDVGMSMNVGGSLVTRPGDTLGSDMALRGGLGLSFDRYDANLDAQWNDGVVNDARRRELDVGFGLGATLGDADRVNVGYTLAWQPDGLTQHTLNGQWQHLWTRDAQSSVTYGRSYALRLDGPTTLTESLGLGVTLTNVIGPNVGVSVGYRLNGEGGLLGGTVAQRLTAGVSTNVALAFDTPAPVVDLFGGRVGGEVSGRLFVDENANGRRDDGERVLAGVRVSVSRASAVTDADGAYVLRVSKGAHTLEVSGLPVTLDVLGRASVDVPENGRVTRDVAVSRVDSLEVSVVDDTNRNGALDADESFVPYARVTIEGPVTRTAVADRRGVVRVSGLPAGRYVVTLDPAGLPDRYEPLSAPPTVELREGERPAPVVLTAAEKPRQQISSFATGSLALLGALGDDEVDRGGSTVMRLRVQGHADDMTVEAFGRTFAVTGTGPDREATIVVPADVQPGTYEVVATARGASTVRTVRRWVAVR